MGGQMKPIPSDVAAASSTVLELLKCNCHGTCNIRSCVCYKEKLACTAMCHVSCNPFVKTLTQKGFQAYIQMMRRLMNIHGLLMNKWWNVNFVAFYFIWSSPAAQFWNRWPRKYRNRHQIWRLTLTGCREICNIVFLCSKSKMAAKSHVSGRIFFGNILSLKVGFLGISKMFSDRF